MPPPTVSGLVGKGKFLNANAEPLTDKMLFGYVIEITMDPTDLRYVADKYKHEKVAEGVTTSALQNAVYSVSFEFDLLDKDGFVLEKLKIACGSGASGAHHKNTGQSTIADSNGRRARDGRHIILPVRRQESQH